jgi:hypothetical protein
MMPKSAAESSAASHTTPLRLDVLSHPDCAANNDFKSAHDDFIAVRDPTLTTSSEDSALTSGTGDPESDLTDDDEEGTVVDDRDGIHAMNIDINKR